uniref:glycosyltransferase family 4 protein n=1 Tax=Shimia sp. TaxID=1954381 RepID=UPI0035696252
MKIVQISPYAMDRPGGVQTHVRDLSHWLRGQGHEVRIVAPPGAAADEGVLTPGRCRNMALHGTAFEVSRAGRAERKACLRDLRSWGAEMVHLHTPWTPMLAWQIWRGLRLPSVATFHATLPEGGGFDPFRAYIRFAARYFHKRLDAIVVPSEAPRAQWRALGVDPLPAILPPVIDLARWRAARQARPPGPHLLFMGRLEERKGVRVLLEAWPAIAAALPGARLTIAGAGALEAPLRKMAEVAAL